MQLSFLKKLLLGFITTLLLVSTLTFIAFQAIEKLKLADEWVTHTQLVLRNANLISGDLSAAEENYGAYIITGNEVFRNNFISAENISKKDILKLRNLVSDNPLQQRQLDTLVKYGNLRLKELKHAIVKARNDGLAVAKTGYQIGNTYESRKKSKEALEKILDTERELLVTRKEQSGISERGATVIIVVCNLLVISVIGLLFNFIRHTFIAKELAERKRRISENRFSNSFKHSAVGQALVSLKGEWMEVNPNFCLFLGYSETELTGLTFQEITHPGDLDQDIQNLNLLKDGTIKNYTREKRYYHKDGHIIWVIINVSIVDGEKDFPRHLFLQAVDITNSKKIASENQKILDTSVDIICSIDYEGRFTQVSKACKAIWGFEVEELVGKRYIDFIVPEDKESTTAIALQITSGIPVTNFQNRYIRKDGSIVPIIWSAKWSEEEKIMFSIARDATEKINLEKAIENEKRRLEELFTVAPTCIAFLAGRDYIFKTANLHYLEITGRNDVVGKRFAEVFPELAENSIKLFNRVFTSGEALSGKEQMVYIEKNKTGILTEMYFDFAYQPYKNILGEVEGIFIFANEITELVQARRKAEESEKRYRQLMEEMPGAVYSCDLDGNILFYNKAAAVLWGRKPKIGIDKWCGSWKIYNQEGIGVPLDAGPMALTLKTGKPVRDKIIIVEQPSGARRTVAPHPFPLFNKFGNLEGAVNMLIDITDHKNVEETLKVQQLALKQGNKMLLLRNKIIVKAKLELTEKALQLEEISRYKSEFLANMSHELRTPLNSILILASLLLENSTSNLNAKQLEYAAVINKSGSDLLSLINDILDLAKIEAGKVDLYYEKTNIEQIVSDMRHLFMMTAEEKKIHFHTWISPIAPKYINTDKKRLEQVIKNLLSNAFKFTHNYGEVQLLIEFEENSQEQLQITVKDTGIGIEENKKQSIFEAFKQADGSTTRKFGGTGLGLSISKELIHKFKGNIYVESTFGKGSDFIIKLPLDVQGELPKEEVFQLLPNFSNSENGTPTNSNLLSGKKVLVVDDDMRNVFALSYLLEEHGVQVYTAYNGKEAISVLMEKEDIEIILLDMMMPEMDGYETIRQIRMNTKHKSLPIIALTAKAMVGDEEKCMEAGATGYISKPFVNKHLLQQVKNCIDKRYSN